MYSNKTDDLSSKQPSLTCIFLPSCHTASILTKGIVKCMYQTRLQNMRIQSVQVMTISVREGVKPGTNARDPGPKSGTNFYWHQKGTKHANNYMKFTPYIV